MKKKQKILLILSAVICVMLCWYIGGVYSQTSHSAHTTIIQTSSFFNQRLFVEGERTKKNYEITPDQVVAGIIIPHHLLATRLISSVFDSIGDISPKTIYIIGPDHDDKGNAVVTTTNASWNTEFGIVRPDISVIEHLGISLDSKLFNQEHSVGTIIPYIAKYFPHSLVVPILVQSRLTQTHIEQLISSWKKIIDMKHSLCIVSVDFSHGVEREKARLQDEQTLVYIRNKNIGAIMRSLPQTIDSPQSIAILEQLFATNFNYSVKLLEHTDSSEFYKDKTQQVTSYYTLLFENIH